MEVRSVPAARGLGWFGEGWRGFKSSPVMLILMFLALVAILILLNLIPLIGGLIGILVTPALTGGLYLAARNALDGDRVDFMQLFEGLGNEDKRGPLLTLGGISLLFSIAMMVIVMVLVFGGAESSPMMGADPVEAQAAMQGAGFGVLLVSMLLAAVYVMAFIYAIPLVMFTGIRPLEAIKTSFGACLKNIPALLVFGLLYLVLGFLATLPMGLGWLILAPMTFVAIYASYREIFPAEPESAEGA